MAERSGQTDNGEIELLRGGRLVSTLTGAFGQSIRETRLTALLGYLVSLTPGPFLKLFQFPGNAQSVRLETNHEHGRSDILIETTRGVGIVEAKISSADPLIQSHRYPARWVALLTRRFPGKAKAGRARYIRWEQVADELAALSTSKSPTVRFLSSDLLAYLQEHRMAKKRSTVEIYAREINEPLTLALFLGAQIYTCNHESENRVAEALYFAPHFGKRIAKHQYGINPGISYVARIETIAIASTWREFSEATINAKGRNWWTRHQEIFKKLRQKWSWDDTQRTVLFLGTPRLTFNPPVRKEAIQGGRGWLSKRFLTFDDLLGAFEKRQETGKRTKKKI